MSSHKEEVLSFAPKIVQTLKEHPTRSLDVDELSKLASIAGVGFHEFQAIVEMLSSLRYIEREKGIGGTELIKLVE